ncbi:hypothetical protein KCP73_05880 [Salmonella enterica subsp. enterica]|nr:hypothetical protein KCP73_05880 [Salmonella enterica subsp. enterica]
MDACYLRKQEAQVSKDLESQRAQSLQSGQRQNPAFVPDDAPRHRRLMVLEPRIQTAATRAGEKAGQTLAKKAALRGQS